MTNNMKRFVLAVLIYLVHVVFYVHGDAGKNGHKLVVYWGQNGVSQFLSSSKTRNKTEYYEKDLETFCKNYNYDIINLSFLNNFFDKKNRDELPGFNFAYHCTKSASQMYYPNLLRCRNIEIGIEECQRRGKKVLMSLGGARGNYGFENQKQARLFAYRIYHLLLEGKEMNELRPFGRAILDGINLDIEHMDVTNNKFYTTFVKELRSIEKKGRKNHLITASPQCPFPDKFLGPAVGKVLGDEPELIDEIYIQFYNNGCHTANQRMFKQRLREWIGFSHNFNGPTVYIGLPAGLKASTSSRHYRQIKDVVKIYETLKDVPPFGGFMLWDASFDQNNQLDDGKHYSDYISGMLKGNDVINTPTISPYSQATPTTNVSTTTTTPTTKVIKTSTNNPFITRKKAVMKKLCDRPSGLVQHPTSCKKFVHCSHGIPYVKKCPAALEFNTKLMVCDWPENAGCDLKKF